MKRGLTVVELMVVIVVIAILAAVSIFAYNGATSDSRDTARRATVDQVVQAINAFRFQKDGVINVGGGSSTGGIDENGICTYNSGGWFNRDNDAAYPCSMGKMLIEAKLLAPDFFDKVIPNDEYGSGTSKSAALMFYRCDHTKGRYLLYYYVKNPTAEEAANLAKLRDPSYCPQAQSHLSDTSMANYKMKAAVEIKL